MLESSWHIIGAYKYSSLRIESLPNYKCVVFPFNKIVVWDLSILKFLYNNYI